MKGFAKLAGIAAFAAIIVFSFASCDNGSTGGGGGGGGGNGELLEFALDSHGAVLVKYKDINYGGITYNGDPMIKGDVLADFTVSIDGIAQTFSQVEGGAACFVFRTGESYTVDSKHMVKVVYTANPSRKVIAKDYHAEEVAVSSFTAEAELTVIGYI